MPSVTEQRGSTEPIQETQNTTEQLTLEVLEHDEAGLRRLIADARNQVESQASNTEHQTQDRLSSLPAKVGITAEKAAAVSGRGGFGVLIEAAKAKIQQLTARTKERLDQLETKESKTSTPSPETKHPDNWRPGNLDEYMASHKPEGLERVKETARLAQLKLKGVKNPERTLGLIRYLEETTTDRKYKNERVKKSETYKIRHKYEKAGFTVTTDDYNEKEGNTRLRATKKVPYHFEMADAKKASRLLESKTDLVALAETLKTLDYNLESYDISVYSERVKSFLDNLTILPLLKKIQSSHGTIVLGKNYGLFSDLREEGEQLEKLAEIDSRENLLSPHSLDNLSKIADFLGHPIPLSSVETWSKISENPNITALLPIIKKHIKDPFPQNSDFSVAKNLEKLVDSGIAQHLIRLSEEGFDSAETYILNLGSDHLIDYAMKKLLPIIQEFETNPALESFIVEGSIVLGIKPTFEDTPLENFRSCFKLGKQTGLDLLGFLTEIGMINGNNWNHRHELGSMVENPETARRITSPEFQTFIKSIRKAGYELNAHNQQEILNSWSVINRAYANERLRTLLTQEQNIATIQHLRLFEYPNWDDYKLEDILSVPDVLQKIKTLKERIGYELKAGDLTNLMDVLQDERAFLELISSKTAPFIKFLQDADSPLFLGDQKIIRELAHNPLVSDKLNDPEFREFFIKMKSRHWSGPRLIELLASCDKKYYPVIETLVTKFSYEISESFLENKDLFQKINDNPEIINIAERLANVGLRLLPLVDFDKLRNISKNSLLDILVKYAHSPAIRNLIISNAELITGDSEKQIPAYLREMLEKTEGLTVRKKQLVQGEVVGTLIDYRDFETLLQIAGPDSEQTPEITQAVEKIKEFVERFRAGAKGDTIATLLVMREYREDENLHEILTRVGKKLEKYEKLINNLSPKNIPSGLRVSMGMEYEVMGHTAAAYQEENQGHWYKDDMSEVARFAQVGQGHDGVFEIATKPSDNPHAMLLEMQLLQDLNFIDFNFRRQGYERGARGYHLTVGGETGVTVGENINFLQNALVISCWGGINAGKDVDRVSRGRGNIRQRFATDANTIRVFSNTSPAVELRALSIDSWEPFERSVTTSYYGTMAVQAFEKHTPPQAAEFLRRIKATDPDELYNSLAQQNLVKEPTDDVRVKQIMFEWYKLQTGLVSDLEDHNTNFLEDEMFGYFDAQGNHIDAKDFGGAENKSRFEGVVGAETLSAYAERTRIKPETLFQTVTAEMENSCTAITNLFIKKSKETGGDMPNAVSILDTTKVGRTIEAADLRAKYLSEFENNGKIREGYYYLQGGSEKMLIHRTQQRLLEFTRAIQNIVF